MTDDSHRYARAPHLWALGVGAVISGDFFGWQSALIAGFDGLLIILAVVTVLYVLLSFSIAELSTTLPTGGGPYVFALHGIGKNAAFFAGLAEALKVVTTCAVVVVGIGSYLNQLLNLGEAYGPIWWVLFYVLFVTLNVLGIELSFRIQLVSTLVSVVLLLVFYVGAATKINYHEWVVEKDWKYPGGLDGVIKGFSFSLWFYLGIEELPLAVEETIEPSKNMPIGLISSIFTLVVLSFCTVIFNSAIAPGAEAISQSVSPLLDGYKTVFGDNKVTAGFTWLLIMGLISSFHSFIFCMGRLLFAIARDGYLPRVLTKLHPTRDTPYVALITGSGLGLALALVLHFAIGDARLGSVMINLALIGALVSYAFQLTAFIRLRIKEPDRERPYRSPFGVPGAIVCLLLCAFVMVTIIYNGVTSTDFVASVVAGALFFVAGSIYYFMAIRPHLSDDAAAQLKQHRENLLSDASRKSHKSLAYHSLNFRLACHSEFKWVNQTSTSAGSMENARMPRMAMAGARQDGATKVGHVPLSTPESSGMASPASSDSPGVRRSTRTPRKRTATSISHGDVGLPRREEKLLRMALAKSVMETKLEDTTASPAALEFHPTVEDFADPIAYITRIQPLAERTGICKIVPPRGWNPPFAVNFDNPNIRFETRRQKIHQLQEGVAYDDGRVHTFRSYQAQADAFRDEWLTSQGFDPRTITSDEIEKLYWRIVQTGAPHVELQQFYRLSMRTIWTSLKSEVVLNGQLGDQTITVRLLCQLDFVVQGIRLLICFAVAGGRERVDFRDPEYYRQTAWNLNNLPEAYGSLLRHMHATMKGINVPWLYCGMLFATFCWHTEDNHMYSVNYQHYGASKRWYGIPSSHAKGFEKVLKKRVPERFHESPDLLFHLTTMISPSALQAEGVAVYSLVQQPGDIVLTFPCAYHGGFSEGFNCNEASNFLLPSWIPFGRESVERYREVGRNSIFSHDHVIYHFGSAQTLQEFTIDECQMLLKELRLMFHEERHFRKEFESAGLVRFVRLNADVSLDAQSMEVDDVRQCFLCKHNVFFSAVMCACKPRQLACPRHCKALCKCPLSDKTYVEWVGSDELRYAIRRVQDIIQQRKLAALAPPTLAEPEPDLPSPTDAVFKAYTRVSARKRAPSTPRVKCMQQQQGKPAAMVIDLT
ncbi:TPA: hypothetical protein N0F65_008759 [Lagenidium giganteum]|uniref:Uncharacterized protein n=1 Tax=Lagenidium giganteum TaxID=4803 RepID=A0AAV2YY03_9STRA|nr:TPA: hypothetical protein N0F65_008759 [Lagenidium giganteum]